MPSTRCSRLSGGSALDHQNGSCRCKAETSVTGKEPPERRLHGRKPCLSARKHIMGPKSGFHHLWWRAAPCGQPGLAAPRRSHTSKSHKRVSTRSYVRRAAFTGGRFGVYNCSDLGDENEARREVRSPFLVPFLCCI